MMDRQLWPQVGYSICNNVSTLDQLENCLQRQEYYQILLLGGVVCLAPKELQASMESGMVAQLNKLVTRVPISSWDAVANLYGILSYRVGGI